MPSILTSTMTGLADNLAAWRDAHRYAATWRPDEASDNPPPTAARPPGGRRLLLGIVIAIVILSGEIVAGYSFIAAIFQSDWRLVMLATWTVAWPLCILAGRRDRQRSSAV
jgi:hypothetical protein